VDDQELRRLEGGGMSPAAFRHEALFYRDRSDYLAGASAFVRAARERGEPVLVAVPGPNLELIRDALGSEARSVELRDMGKEGRNPGRILPGVLLAFAREHAGRPVRIIGEPIWPGRTHLEYPACVQHEALINAAFAGVAASILCPYDTARLGPAVLADAARTHPILVRSGAGRPSRTYTDPVRVAELFNQPLPDPPATAATMTVRPSGLSEVRRFVAEQATSAGLSEVLVNDAVLAVNELASNTVDHTSQPGWLSIWPETDVLACQIRDCGHLTNPLVGRVPAAPGASRGRGLVLVNQLCELVRVHTRPGRTTIRVHLSR
jgi:anti-sigma regulatory factor (Ser/Thr protein kinase)